MVTESRDVKLLIRAQDLSAKTFQEVRRSIEEITSSLDEQTRAAQTGEVSIGELRDTMERLRLAGTALAQQDDLIRKFQGMGAAETAAATASAKAAQQLQEYRTSLASLGAPTEAQIARLARFEAAVVRAADAERAAAEKSAAAAAKLEAARAEMAGSDAPTDRQVTALGKLEAKINSTAEAERRAATTTAAAVKNLEEYRTKINSVGEATERQVAGLKRREKAVQDTAAAEAKLAQDTAAFAERIKAAGLNTADLAGEQERLAQSAVQVGAGLGRLTEVSLNYNRTLRESRTQRREAAEAADQQRAAERALSSAIQETIAQENAAKAQREASAAAENRIRDAAEAENRARDAAAAKALASFQAAGAEAVKAASGYRTLSEASARLAVSSNTAASAVQKVLDPAGAQRTTLDGLEKQVEKLGIAVNAISGPVEAYEVQLKSLGAVQNDIARKAVLVDSFRDQTAAVVQARAAFAQARQEARELGQAMASAAAPSDEMAAATKRALAAVSAAERELSRELQKAQQLRVGLRDAGLATNDLAATQRRLVTAANQTTESVTKLNQAFRDNGRSTAGDGLFGLQPYALQNLSYQINDVFTSLASGASVLTVVAQQGGQILQLFPGAFTAMAAGLAANIPLAVALAAGLGGVVIAFASLSRQQADAASTRAFTGALVASADGARYTAQQLTAVSRELSRLGVSFDEARKGVTTFVSAGLDPSQLVQYGQAARNLADLFGKEFPEAATELTTAFRSGFSAIAEFDDKYELLTASQRERIRVLFDEGKAEEARRVAFELTSSRIAAGAEAARGPWTSAFRAVGAAWQDFMGYLANTAPVRIAVAALNGLAGVVQRVAESISRAFRSTALEGAQGELEASRARLAALQGGLRARAANGEPTQQERNLVAQIAEQEAAVKRLTDAQAASTGQTERQTIRAEEFLRERRRELTTTDELTDAEKLLRAEREERGRASSAGLTDADIERAVAARVAVEQTRIATEEATRAEEARTAAQRDGANSQRIIAAGEARVEAARQRGTRSEQALHQIRMQGMAQERLAISEQETGILRTAEARAQEARDGINSARIRAAGEAEVQRVRALGVVTEERLEAAREKGMQAERARVAEETRNGRAGESAANRRLALERQVLTQLDALRAQASRSDRTDIDARVRALQERYATFFRLLDSLRGGTVAGAPVEQVRAQAQEQLRILEQQERMKGFEETLNALATQRREEFARIAEEQTSRNISGAEALERIQEVTSRIRPEMQATAQAALDFARNLSGANVERFRAAVTTRGELNIRAPGEAPSGGDDAATRGAAERVAAANAVKIAEAEVSRLFQERNATVQTYNALLEQNQIGYVEAQSRIRGAFASSNDEIVAAIRNLEEANQKARDLRSISASAFDLTTAKVAQFSTQVAFVSPELRRIEQAGQQAFASSLVSGLNDVSESLAKVIDGTGSWADALDSVRNMALSVVAAVLRGIAQEILATQALILWKTALNAVSGGTSGAAGAIAGVVRHTGGVIGVGGARREVHPGYFREAPRYHSGSGGPIGLRRDEMAAILQRGEEVLARDDPRNVLNSARQAASRPSGGEMSIRNVLVADPSYVPEAMASSAGERVTMSVLKKNAVAVRQMLGMGR